MTRNPISESEFGSWKHEDVTKAFMEKCKRVLEAVELQLQNPDYLMGSTEDQKKLVYALAQKETLIDILTVSYEDIKEEDDG